MKNRDKLHYWELAALLALSVTLCAGAWAQGRQSAVANKLLRLHVVAASDDEYEQQLKLKVRDAVLEYLSPRLSTAEDIDTAKALISAELEGIQAAAEAAAEGRAVTVTLGQERYPTKSYEGYTLPAGRYESLRVVLGDGEGHNWWCIVFPPVCLSAVQSQTAEQQLGEDDFQLISDNEGYRLKFRTVELWGELCNWLNL